MFWTLCPRQLKSMRKGYTMHVRNMLGIVPAQKVQTMTDADRDAILDMARGAGWRIPGEA